MVVDDDDALRRMLTRTLEEDGYRVLEAEHGEAALGIVGGLVAPVGLVLTDIQMPVMNGFEFARAFRLSHPSIPILFMTGAMPQSSAGISLRDVGARLLLKPFGPEVLLEAVQSVLTRGPSARRTPA